MTSSTDEKPDTNGRDDPVQLESERGKCLRGDRHARDALPDAVRPVYIHDRGADAVSFYRELSTDLAAVGFVVRANQNRRIRTPAGEEELLFDWRSELEELGQRTIQIQQGGDRDARAADRSIAAGSCQ